MSQATLFADPTMPPEVRRSAVISPCKTYRYRLTRYWGSGPMLPFIMLNPSIADAEIDDPTIRRCMGFARREGLGGIVVGNIHAFRATRPEDLKHTADPFGPDNPDHLWGIAVGAVADRVPIVCAWGVSGGMFAGDGKAIRLMQEHGGRLVCLGKTANGMPRHPLYVRADQPFEPFRSPSDHEPPNLRCGDRRKGFVLGRRA